MKRLFTLFLLVSSAYATTPVTGNLADLSGTAVASKSKVRMWLRGCNGNQPRVIGTSIIAPTNGNTFYFDLTPNGSGVISGTIYSNDVNVSCGGQVGVTWYGMQVFVNGTPGPETCLNALDGVSLNLNSAGSCSATPVVPTPTGDNTYARLDGGNQPFIGTITAPSVVGSNTSKAGDGTLTLPGFSFNLEPGTGFQRTSAGQFSVNVLGSHKLLWDNTQRMASNFPLAWSSNTEPFGNTPDVGISRFGAGRLAIGNGTQADVSGLLNLSGITLNSGVVNAGVYGIGAAGFLDTGLSRTSAGVIAIGNGTAGNATGAIQTGTGSLGSPSISAGNVGLYNVSSNWEIVTGGANQWLVGNSLLRGNSTALIGMSSNVDNTVAISDVNLNRGGVGVYQIGTGETANANGTLRLARVRASGGSTVVTGDFVLNASWGSTASKSAISGTDASGTIAVTANGAGIAANPLITFTFHDGTTGSQAQCALTRNDTAGVAAGSGAVVGGTTSLTQATIGLFGTPTAGNTYVFTWLCM